MVSDLPKVTELLSGEAENKTGAPDIQSGVLSAVPWDLGICLVFFQEERKQNMPEARRVDVFLAQHQL